MNQLVHLPAIAIAAVDLPAMRPFATGTRWLRTSRTPMAMLSRGRCRAQAGAAGPASALPEGGVHRLFERQAARAPGAIAIRTDDGNWTYGRLNAAANVLARRLRRQGVRPGHAVATVLERSARLVAAALAIVKCGATHVPLDPHATPAWLAHVLADSAAQAVLADAARLPQLAGGPVALAVNGAVQPRDSRNLHVEAPAGTPACMLYPAASSGKSLGHGLPHATLARLAARNGYAEFGATDCVAFAGGSPADVAALELWGRCWRAAALPSCPVTWTTTAWRPRCTGMR
ncbi:AMP-binding protein [Pseudoduganella armeniaca]|nr:AMP-binding protein [Pseudoduganella armeniaca]